MKEELGLRIAVCDDEEKERASLRQLLVMELNAAQSSVVAYRHNGVLVTVL